MGFNEDNACTRRFIKHKKGMYTSIIDDIEGCPDSEIGISISYHRSFTSLNVWIPDLWSDVKDTIRCE